ncbi:MAG TPA: alpha/beta hydrolase [Stellaceae bacterium]|jgi:pimeloyl-ACP methyl ester carboxylesterase|nr:alpha/beta hydrolase [Stellaceae bacterium]
MATHVPGPLYFEQQGRSGTPMVFLHSTPDDHRLWLYQTAHFSSWYRTIAIDLAGYGRSPAVQDGVTIADQAAACWEAVDRVSDGTIILHGNSIGSGVAQRMVEQKASRVLALILSGTGYSPSAEVFQRWVQRYRDEGIALRYQQLFDHFAPGVRKDPILTYYADMVVELNNAGTLASVIAMNQANVDRPPESYYRSIKVPTLIIGGTEDRSYASSFDLQKLIAGSAHRSIAGAGHAPMIEMPWEYDRHVIEFLKTLGLFTG